MRECEWAARGAAWVRRVCLAERRRGERLGIARAHQVTREVSEPALGTTPGATASILPKRLPPLRVANRANKTVYSIGR